MWATIRTSLTHFGFFYIYISAKNLLPTAENLWKRKIQYVSCEGYAEADAVQNEDNKWVCSLWVQRMTAKK